MKFVFASYVVSDGFNDPQAWLKRINAYLGTLEVLATTNTVISIEQINYEGEVLKNGVQYYFKKLPVKQRLYPVQLHRFIKKQKPDIVIIHGLGFPLQVMQLRLMLGRKTPIILQHHAERPFKGLKKLAFKLADRGVDAYLFSSKTMGTEWVEQSAIGHSNKIHEVMPVSSVFSQINKQCALSRTGISGQPAFIWVGRLDNNKDPLTTVRAFLRYLKLQPSARLYMIFQSDELLFEIRKILNAEHAYKNSIILVGKIAHPELLYWFNSVDFVISSSHYESGGAAVCEAISCGCIPVLTDIDSFRIITNHGQCGLLYEAGNEHSLFNALQQTSQMNIIQEKARVLAHYQLTLSFGAIAGRINAIVAGLST